MGLEALEYDDFNYCYECGGYGDDYFLDEDGDLQYRCPECPFNPQNIDEDVCDI